jgi:hypothetical protein
MRRGAPDDLDLRGECVPECPRCRTVLIFEIPTDEGAIPRCPYLLDKVESAMCWAPGRSLPIALCIAAYGLPLRRTDGKCVLPPGPVVVEYRAKEKP